MGLQAASQRTALLRDKAKFENICRQNNGNFHAWWNLARINLELGFYPQAMAAFDRALEFKPNHIEVLIGKTLACLQSGKFQDALNVLDHAQRFAPKNSDILLHKADVLRRLERNSDSLALYDRILNLSGLARPKRLYAISAKTAILTRLERYEDALESVTHGLALSSADPGLLLNQSTLLLRLRRYEEALAVLKKLENKQPADFVTLDNKARALAALQRFSEAEQVLASLRTEFPLELRMREYDKPGVIVPGDAAVVPYTAKTLYLNALLDGLNDCDWRQREAVITTVDALAAASKEDDTAHHIDHLRLLSVVDDQAALCSLAKARAHYIERCVAPLRDQYGISHAIRDAGERLRIGYVCGEFRNHATAHLTRKLFRLHDHGRFEIYAYGLQADDGSSYRRDIANACSHFTDVTELSNLEAAKLIAEHGIHILVDLNGYTRYGRPEIFALRPAPIQVSYLAYPGTLGADFIQYIVADSTVIPETQLSFYVEQPVFLPDCYQVNDDEQPIAETGVTRIEQGLPEDAFVYCCFNASHKIDPVTFSVWMDILRATSNSVLWLLGKNRRVISNLRQAAQDQGIDPQRLVFAQALPKAEHLERHRLADLFLDTFIYNAHTTASDSLWAGLPVLTYCGGSFPARVCASLLYALGMPELITHSSEAFKKQAVALANRPGMLTELRIKLKSNRSRYPLFDTERFTRNLENLYETMWQTKALSG